MADAMREALERLRREASRIERDQHKYAELAYSPTADVLESIADDIDSALAEQPAQGEAVAQIVNGELMWFIPHQSYALDAKFRSGRWMLYPAPPAPSEQPVQSCKTCGGSKVDPGGLGMCRDCRPAQGEAVGWLTDQGTFHFDKTDAWNDSEGFIEPLYTAPPAPSVPDGWKLVPIRATDGMTKAARYDEDAFGGKSAWPSDIWRDMVRAAPEVPRG